MTSTRRRSPSELPLEQLVQHALGELNKLHYNPRTVRRYRTVWKHLVTFAALEQLGDKYSEQLTARFIDAYQSQRGARLAQKYTWRRYVAFSVKVLGDFVRDRRIKRSFIYSSSLTMPNSMIRPFSDYAQYCSDRLYLSPLTLEQRTRTLALFCTTSEKAASAGLTRCSPRT